MPRLKTYAAEIDGLHEWIVAAPNQRAALDALGVHQDLFAQGLAKVSDDAAAQTAAEARPLTPLRRAKGSKAAFKPTDDGGGDVWAKAAAAAPQARKAKPPSRAALDRAEAAMARFETVAASALDDIAAARADLDSREASLRQAQDRQRGRLEKAVAGARAAYRKAGGR